MATKKEEVARGFQVSQAAFPGPQPETHTVGPVTGEYDEEDAWSTVLSSTLCIPVFQVRSALIEDYICFCVP